MTEEIKQQLEDNARVLMKDLAKMWHPDYVAPLDVQVRVLKSEVRDLYKRVADLERGRVLVGAPAAKKKSRSRYFDVPQTVADEHWNFWAPLWIADPEYASLPPTVAQELFASRNGLSVREFRRWFTKRNTHAPGSSQDVRFRQRIADALAKLKPPDPLVS